MKKILILSLTFFLLNPFCLFAEDIASTTAATTTADNIIETPGVKISPMFLDEPTKARDIIERTITIKNDSQNYASLYVIVNDLTAEGKVKFEDPTDLDKTTSLARWIQVKRGPLDIAPGEQYDLPLRIEVNMNAKPGIYHASIAFSQASNRTEAEEKALNSNLPTLLINTTVEDNVIEKAEIQSLKPAKNIFFSLPVILNLNIKNIGNRPITPAGTMIIYDRNGREVDSLKINDGNINIQPEATENFSFNWKPAGAKNLGKYKAKVDIAYGEKSDRDLSDSVYFWVLPIYYLVFTLIFVLIVIILLTIFLFRRTFGRHSPVSSGSDGVINLRN